MTFEAISDAIELLKKLQEENPNQSILKMLQEKKYNYVPKTEEEAKRIAGEWILKDLMEEGIIREK